ncbi:nucleotidyltransferase family protein [Carboxylicivirga sp. M1479]|uniref:nucleotidyltransferase family protein n=1 Tax=Carboxylicivirga sp. M1479 TaxID=2594476 RepID=UPI001177BBBE|nr:nucleotidyltransferase family protein [Carboxylicivirga sp. M1479]TRX59834.1 nucleotidyltransferase family protein [Carboxylicivirga sp. M1479]
MTKDTIIHTLTTNSQMIKSYGVDKIGIFGSYARNQQTEQSDIDIVVKFEDGKKSYKAFIKLAYYLEEILNKKVDLVTYKSLSDNFIAHIEKEIRYVALGH